MRAVASAAARSRSAMATFAPSRTKMIAISLPMPLAAPVIRATLFSRRIETLLISPPKGQVSGADQQASFADLLKAMPTRPTQKATQSMMVAAVDVEDLAGDEAGGVVARKAQAAPTSSMSTSARAGALTLAFLEQLVELGDAEAARVKRAARARPRTRMPFGPSSAAR